VWNAANGALRHALDQGGGTSVMNIAFGSGSLLAASSADGAIQLWNAREGQPVGTLPGSGGANSIAFSSDGTLVASGGADGNVRLWGAS
jgi:WD40 repeat protein